MWCFCKESLDGMDGISTEEDPDFVPDDGEQGCRSTPNLACGTGPVRDVFADAVLWCYIVAWLLVIIICIECPPQRFVW